MGPNWGHSRRYRSPRLYRPDVRVASGRDSALSPVTPIKFLTVPPPPAQTRPISTGRPDRKEDPLGQVVDLVEVLASRDGHHAGLPQVLESGLMRRPAPPAAPLDALGRLEVLRHERTFDMSGPSRRRRRLTRAMIFFESGPRRPSIQRWYRGLVPKRLKRGFQWRYQPVGIADAS